MGDTPKTCSIHAPCKINLHLAIKDRRADGFHNLESVFAALDFGDDLFFELAGKEGFYDLSLFQNSVSFGKGFRKTVLKDSFSFKSKEVLEKPHLIVNHSPDFGEFLPDLGEKNLISRAVSLFRQKTGFNQELRCVLDKKIPVGAGLGGGSSDAASTLIALNSLSGANLSIENLSEMAAILGSDAPFFLKGGAAYVTGRGEHIKPLPQPPDYAVLLAKPPFHSLTAEAFRLFDQNSTRTSAKNIDSGSQGWRGSWPESSSEWLFYNDFLSVLPQSKIYTEICHELRQNGAEFAGLSGSGSCCFGIFKDLQSAQKAEIAIKSAKIELNFTQCTFFLASAAIPVLE